MFEFDDGTIWDVDTITSRLPAPVGTAEDDSLPGFLHAEHISGLAGNDIIDGFGGDDTLDGGAGDDELDGGSGNDNYLLALGDGNDTLYDSATAEEGNRLIFAEGITRSSLNLVQETGGLRIRYSDTDSVLLDGQGIDGNLAVAEIAFADGSVMRLDQSENQAPVAQVALANLAATQGIAFRFDLPANTFVDPDQVDTLSYTARLADGSALPDWLNFDALAGVFSGTPGNADIGEISIVLTATDSAGLSASATFALSTGRAMVGSSATDNLTGTASNDVIDSGIGNDSVDGGAGDDIIVGGPGSDVLKGGAGNDVFRISGTDWGNDRFDGGEGYDVVQGSTGDDTIRISQYGGTDTVERIDGGGGQDTIAGTGSSDNLDFSTTELVGTAQIDSGVGNDAVTGSIGNDIIVGGAGSDTLKGGAGNDVFRVSGTDWGNDRFDGGEGYDVVQGSTGDDTIRISQYGGTDTVERIDGGGGQDTIAGTGSSDDLDFSTTELVGIVQIDSGVGNDAVTGSIGNDIIVGGAGSDTLKGGAGNDIFRINGTDWGNDRFDGGEGYDVVQGSTGDDTIRISQYGGTDTVERIDGGGGQDTIAGTGSSDNLDFSTTELVGIAQIDSGVGNDAVIGSAGNDTIIASVGNDTLKGGAGNDTYVFGIDSGLDTVSENDSTVGNTDVVRFLAGVASDQIWFRHVGDNLVVNIIGTTDKLTIQNWYSGVDHHIEQFKTADNKQLLDSRIDNLVQAMAAFSPPAAGQTTLPQNYQDALASVISTNWQ